jgi:hypothetical protein
VETEVNKLNLSLNKTYEPQKLLHSAVDSNGNACFGSFDKGISCFDGHRWKTYVIPKNPLDRHSFEGKI